MLRSFNIKQILIDLLKSNIYTSTIVNFNRDRLFNTGRDVKGNEITTFSKSGSQVYAKWTIKEKEKLDLPTNVVTGYMTGKLHESIVDKTNNTFIDVVANKQRMSLFLENISSDHEMILGLNEEDKKIVIGMLERDLIQRITNEATEEHFIDTELLRYV